MASPPARTALSLPSTPHSQPSHSWVHLEKRQKQEKDAFEARVNRLRGELLKRHDSERTEFWDHANIVDLVSEDESSNPFNETAARGHGAAHVQKLPSTPRVSTPVNIPKTPKTSKSIKNPATPKSLKRRRVQDVSDSDDSLPSTLMGSPTRSTLQPTPTSKATTGFRSIRLPIPQQTPKHAFRAATPHSPVRTTSKANSVTTPSPSAKQPVSSPRTPSSRAAKSKASSRIAEQAKLRDPNADIRMDTDTDYEEEEEEEEEDDDQMTRNMREMSITPTPGPQRRTKTEIYSRAQHLRDRAGGDRALAAKTGWVDRMPDEDDATAFLDQFRATGSRMRRDDGFRGQSRVEGGNVVQHDRH